MSPASDIREPEEPVAPGIPDARATGSGPTPVPTTPIDASMGDLGDLPGRLGVASTLGLGLVLLGWALTVDFPKVTTGFFSDGATYYSLAHSLAEDLDFEYRREDLVRVWREYPGGPEGIFLKRGRDVQGVGLTSVFPFVQLTTREDWDTGRLYYGKAFIFPLVAAPFVRLFGTNGFLVLHAVLMTICFACAYAFLVSRSAPVASMLFAVAFLLVSVAPVYMVWLTPDFFNLALILIAYFLWCYKEVRPASTHSLRSWRLQWLLGARSDLVAAVLLAIATFSKPTHVLLIGPMLALFALRQQWRRGVTAGLVFGGVVAALFAWNVAITGEWNYQGGEDRKTFYSAQGSPLGGFPFQSERHTFDATGIVRETNRLPVEVLTNRDAISDVLRRNLVYFLVGRHTGFVPYYFPGAVAIALFLFGTKGRSSWQWLTLAGGLASAVALILYMPFTYSGGGGPVGNRYFLGVYPVFLFVTPPLASAVSGAFAIGVSALFTAQLILNPFYVSFRPGEHTKTGFYRILPVELSLLNDLPVNVSASRAKQPLGGTPAIAAYFLDDNAYNREGDAFWVRGESRAELMLRAPVVTDVRAEGEVARPLQVGRLEVLLETGAVPNRVTVKTGAATAVVDLPANDRRSLVIAMPPGLPYRPFPELPTNYVYLLSIESESGFIPLFQSGTRDNRFLGVFVRLVPYYE